MKIALLNEFSQAPKNSLIFETLKNTAEPLGHEVFNVGMTNPISEQDVASSYSKENPRLSYLHLGIEAALLLNAGIVDFIVTGCGTGQGALMSLNAYPGVACGYCIEPTDAYLFMQINNGNALSIPFAKGFGWGAEVNLKNIFSVAFSVPKGLGYPSDRKKSQNTNASLLADVKLALSCPLLMALSQVNQKLVKEAVTAPNFIRMFDNGCQNLEILEFINKYR